MINDAKVQKTDIKTQFSHHVSCKIYEGVARLTLFLITIRESETIYLHVSYMQYAALQ